MSLKKLSAFAAALLPTPGAASPAANAQSKKDTLVLAMALEPAPGLDPTAGAASAIAAAFVRLYELIANTPRAADRAKSLGDAQRLLATDAANVFLYQPQWITVTNKRVKGRWKDMPVFVNDLAALAWE